MLKFKDVSLLIQIKHTFILNYQFHPSTCVFRGCHMFLENIYLNVTLFNCVIVWFLISFSLYKNTSLFRMLYAGISTIFSFVDLVFTYMYLKQPSYTFHFNQWQFYKFVEFRYDSICKAIGNSQLWPWTKTRVTIHGVSL